MQKISKILIILVAVLFAGVAFLFCLDVYNSGIPKGCCENYPSCCVKGRYGQVQWRCSGICEKGGVVKEVFKTIRE